MEAWVSVVALFAIAIVVALSRQSRFFVRKGKDGVRGCHSIMNITVMSSQYYNPFSFTKKLCCEPSLTFANFLKSKPKKYIKIDPEDAITDPFHIEPLPNFNWRTTPPLKFRTFKQKYHLTMGLTTTTFSDLLQIDSNYLTRLHLRTQIIKDHHSIAIQASPTITPAVNELYTWLVTTYLPTRFPSLFTISPSNPSLLNHATSLSLPLTPSSSPIQTLELLGQNLDEDFLFLLPSPDGDGYILQGYVTCFPAGFNTKKKFGLKLRNIHSPVPGYKEKLEKSMDRFFDRLEIGKVVLRSNVSPLCPPILSISPNIFLAD